MIIKLNEIKDEPLNLQFSEGNSELSTLLKDLIGGRKCSADVTLRRSSDSTFEMKGWIRTEVAEQCSRCAEDFEHPINELFREMLLPSHQMPRDGHETKVNHVSDLHAEGPSVTEYVGDEFNLGDYLRSVIVMAKPDFPSPDLDSHGKCGLCHVQVAGSSFSYDEDFEAVVSPFSVLKNIKLN